MNNFQKSQNEKLLSCYKSEEELELQKSEVLNISKGGKAAFIGEKRTFGGREYIKTAEGWKFHGKGTGTKAQAHAAGASAPKEKPEEKDFPGLKEETEKHIKQDIAENKKPKEKELSEEYKEASDFFQQERGRHYITNSSKFKPGDKVRYKDEYGTHHKGTVSDRMHPEAYGIYEIDRETKDSKREMRKPNGWITDEFKEYLNKNKEKIWPSIDFSKYTNVQVQQTGSPESNYIRVSGKNSSGIPVQIAATYLDGKGSSGVNGVMQNKNIESVVKNFK